MSEPQGPEVDHVVALPLNGRSTSSSVPEKLDSMDSAGDVSSSLGEEKGASAMAMQQLWALTRKNWIVLRHHWIINVIRCVLLPICYFIFLAYCKDLISTHDDLGLSTPGPLRALSSEIGTRPIYWIDASGNASTASGALSASSIISFLTATLPASARHQVKQLDAEDELLGMCQQSFTGLSNCFGAVIFHDFGGPLGAPATAGGTVNYTLRMDSGLNVIRVSNRDGDYDRRHLPLQWAIDSAIIRILTGDDPPLPNEQPFSLSSDSEQTDEKRILFLSGVYSLIVLAFFIGFLGVVWHLPSSVSAERGSGMTALAQTMGCGQFPRILQWITGPAAAYFPAYFAMGGIVASQLFTKTEGALTVFAHVLPGAALASWSLFMATFFKRANLSAVITTGLAIVLAIVALLVKDSHQGTQIGLSVVFPPMAFVFLFLSITRYEMNDLPAIATKVYYPDGNDGGGASPLSLLIISIVDIFLWLFLAAALERLLYYPESFFKTFRRPLRSPRAGAMQETSSAPTPAIEVDHFSKKYGKSLVVDNLSFTVPHGSLTALLGSNGSGKSTTIGAMAGWISATSGAIRIEGHDRSVAPRGLLGVCPQKNVFWEELTAKQHVEVFRGLKDRRETMEDAEDLLCRCDLANKVEHRPGSLSGGQKRKLQLAAALVGGSQVLLIDECTSGLDPLSRRQIWKILLGQRGKTILLTTHFLDEADLLASELTILAAPGKKLAQGSPLSLKSSLGDGYTLRITPIGDVHARALTLVERVRVQIPGAGRVPSPTPSDVVIALPTKDIQVVAKLLRDLEGHKQSLGIVSYDVHGPTLESVFLKLNAQNAQTGGESAPDGQAEEKVECAFDSDADPVAYDSGRFDGTGPAELSDGRPIGILRLAAAHVYKRMLLLRRTWIVPVLALAVAILGSVVPLIFLRGRDPSCSRGFSPPTIDNLFFPGSDAEQNALNSHALDSRGYKLLLAPPTVEASMLALGVNASAILPGTTSDFTALVDANYSEFFLGGITVDARNVSTFSYNAQSADAGLVLLNLVSNSELERRSGSASSRIYGRFQTLSSLTLGNGLGGALKWAAIFGLAQAVWPAFAALYPTAERVNRVKALHLTNGLSPLPLWLGHVCAELPVVIIASVVVTVLYLVLTDQFKGGALLWFCFFLYGLAASIESMVVSLFAPSQLAAFAIVCAWNVIVFLIYFMATLLALTFYTGSDLTGTLSAIHYPLALLSPTVSVVRTSWVTANLFGLLCDGTGAASNKGMGSFDRFGAPILYFILWALFAFSVLVWWDSGALRPSKLSHLLRRKKPAVHASESAAYEADVLAEADRVDAESEAGTAAGKGDILRVCHVSKIYPSTGVLAVDDVTFGVARNETFALAGINGGGKSTLHSMIRCELRPTSGSIYVQGTDTVEHRSLARSRLGVCPQFDALDPNLTVREHLKVYARVQGLDRRARKGDVRRCMELCDLLPVEHRHAGKLSGGNQRKLSLAISLLGNPSVILLDELTSGVDAYTKRHLWKTLQKVSEGRATLFTSHSMEEVEVLASRVAIQASRLLAIGTTSSLRSKDPVYEIQVDLAPDASPLAVHEFMASCLPGCTPSDEASNRFQVPVRCVPSAGTGGRKGEEGSDGQERTGEEGEGGTIADLFEHFVRAADDAKRAGVRDAQLSPEALESIFLKVVRGADLRRSGAGASASAGRGGVDVEAARRGDGEDEGKEEEEGAGEEGEMKGSRSEGARRRWWTWARKP